MNKWLRRALIGTPLAIAAAAATAPFIHADYFRPLIQRRLEAALGRPIEIKGSMQFRVLPRPGFSLEEVVIHELPAFSAEPLAYVPELDIAVSLASALRGRLAVAGINLIEPSINLMKLDKGGWNAQALVDHALQGASGVAPAVEVSGGRINFKFGDTKSVFYLAATDLTVEAEITSPERLGLKFSGEPARTDRASRAFGKLSGRGMIEQGPETRLDLSLALERTPISEIVTLALGRNAGLGGLVTTRARVSGTISNLDITGRLEMDEFERLAWLIPRSASGWGVDVKGSLDLSAQSLKVETQRTSGPVTAKLRARDFLSRPRWSALIELRDAPLTSVRALVADAGAAVPAWPVEGRLSGVLGFTPGGPGGALQVTDASLSVPSLGAFTVERAVVVIATRDLTLAPATFRRGDTAATVETHFNTETGARDIRIDTAGMEIADLLLLARAFGPAPLPGWIERCRAGTWSGRLRFQQGRDETGSWRGAMKLESAQLGIDGVSAPVTLDRATAALRGASFSIDAMEGSAGELGFRGSVAYDAQARRPVRLRLSIPEASAQIMNDLLSPALRRNAGLLARTLRRPGPPPVWLRGRSLEATLEVGTLEFAGYRLEAVRTRVFWDGPRLVAQDMSAAAGGGTMTGRLAASFTGPEPAWTGHLEFSDLSWREGTLSVEGDFEALSEGAQLGTLSRLGGAFTARDIKLAGDQQFQTLSGCFTYTPRTRLQFTGVQAEAPGETLTGQGGASPDGRLALDLASPQRTLRVAGRVSGMQLEFR